MERKIFKTAFIMTLSLSPKAFLIPRIPTLFGKTYQSIDQAMAQAQPFLQKSLLPNASGDGFASDEGNGPDNEKENSPAEDLETVQPLQDIGAMLTEHIWVVWCTSHL